MYRVFVEPCDIDEGAHIVTIRGGEVNHIKNVLRMKPGEELDACESTSRRLYRCIIEEPGPDYVRCRLCFIKEADTELASKIYLYQGLPKADKLELIIQKAVELGVSEVIPVSCARSVVRLDEGRQKKKTERWQAIAQGAAQQSRRAFVPAVHAPLGFKEAIDHCVSTGARGFIPYELLSAQDTGSNMERTRELFSAIAPGESVALFIGPEGGFDESEIAMAERAGVIPITLGRRILRTETAAITVMAWLNYVLER